MNAVMREEHEVHVVSNETIEASIGFLRNGLAEVKEDVREVRAEVRSLSDKVDRNHETLSRKIDDVRSELLARTDYVDSKLTAKIDQGLQQLHLLLGETNVAIARLGSVHRAVLWIVGGIVSLAGLLEIALRLGKVFGLL